MHKILHNILKLVALLVIQCHATNVSAQEDSFDDYIDSLLALNRMEVATIRDSLYSQNPGFSSCDLVVLGNTNMGYLMIACDSIYSTYVIEKSDNKWQYTTVDPFDRELFPYKDGTPGETADFKNNPPNKLSFPDSLSHYIKGPSVFCNPAKIYFATYFTDNTFVDFITPILTNTEIVPSGLIIYLVQVLLNREHTLKAGKKKTKKIKPQS